MNNVMPIFHEGEIAVQKRLGVDDRMDKFGRMMIRDHMPDQHREFYSQLPMLFAGHTDINGRVWASVLAGKPGFLTTSSDKTLSVNTKPLHGDPLTLSLNDLKEDHSLRIGILGIELSSRRRNRMSTELKCVSKNGFDLNVLQTFGNCPQYIQSRELHYVSPETSHDNSVDKIEVLSAELIKFIGNSDTFFVASSNDAKNGTDKLAAPDGADISHRGGKPGFIRVDDNKTLTIPDYSGNFHFNTLGNFEVNPSAGLLFLDFEHGHVISLTGRAEIIWNSPDQKYFEGAERLWRFYLEEGRILKHALPYRWSFVDYSPNSLLTGSWHEAEATERAEKNRNEWQTYRVEKLQTESQHIRSVYLKPVQGAVPKFLPGQFITIKAPNFDTETVRTYTVSSAPNESHIRISVKNESNGLVSPLLHTQLKIRDTLQVKAPRGEFSLDTSETRPAVLISAGVGITPMVAMAKHTLMEGIRTRHTRPLIVINAFRNKSERAFFLELSYISEASKGAIKTYSALSQPEDDLIPGVDYHIKGRISKHALQHILPIDDYDFYVCGPSSFMQNIYDQLRELGVDDGRVFAESFGPSSLVRENKSTQSVEDSPYPEAESAVVEFIDAKIEQAWTKDDGNLLEFAESHGLTPAYGCRNGQCGSCKVKVIQGNVTHSSSAAARVDENEALLCCARPAETPGQNVSIVKLAM